MFCPDCGLKNRNNAKFCRTCGKDLRNLPEYSPDKKKSAGKIASPSSPSVAKRAKPPVSPVINATPHQSVPVQQVPPVSPSQGASSPSGVLNVGDLIDRRYQVVKHIATGGMGAIYKGEDTRLQTVVAIKEMIDFFQTEEDKNYAIKRFREEALLLADLRHPNIPRVTDNFIENNKYYLIMDFVEGKSAEKIILENGGRGLPEAMVLEWGIQICDVLDYLHSHNPPIIYRDMKPSNIMILDDGNVRLVDFGIARHFSPRRPGTMIGTHGYAPPEQYKGNTEPKSDIYALGATMHHLLTGNDPTKGVPFNFRPIRQLKPDLSEGMERILDKALENLPDKRFNTAGEMKRELENLKGRGASGASSAHSSRQSVPQSANMPSSVPPPSSQPASYVQPPPRKSFNQEMDAQKHYEKGKSFFNAGNLSKALEELDKAVRLCPNHPQAQCLIGYVLLQMNNYSSSLNHLLIAVTLAPKNALAHLYLGKAYARVGNIHESRKEYRIAERLDPGIFRQRSPGILEQIFRSILS